ncbi:flagellar protein FlaG [Caulobacter sp. 17J80-11]|uniref:flagellar protein FlaG n=1 Tax=Caulobacter sp. 17J80-11 TaxID=2763502 RepID=UPI0021035419|nr:flagellar protein FlaG [Caulobacter sp. 17J80-11]
MATNVGKVAPVNETIGLQSWAAPQEVQPQRAPEAAISLGSSDYRLVIEQDPESGTFIYRTVDRRTGEVVQQLPREELLKWRRDPAYVAGSLIAAKA